MCSAVRLPACAVSGVVSVRKTQRTTGRTRASRSGRTVHCTPADFAATRACSMVSSRRVPLLPSRRAEHLMGMPQAAQRWTPAMVRALPEDGNRYEVVAGELFVTPAPSFDHQQAVARL